MVLKFLKNHWKKLVTVIVVLAIVVSFFFGYKYIAGAITGICAIIAAWDANKARKKALKLIDNNINNNDTALDKMKRNRENEIETNNSLNHTELLDKLRDL